MAGSQFWGTGSDLMALREILDPLGAKELIVNIGKKMFGGRYDYTLLDFRGLNLPVTIIDTQTGQHLIITPYWHLMTEDGLGNHI